MGFRVWGCGKGQCVLLKIGILVGGSGPLEAQTLSTLPKTGLGCRVMRFRVSGLGLRVEGLGFRV